ncbi:MAG: FAD-dependent oxidoreductase, partial [Acidobacteriota bacterium]
RFDLTPSAIAFPQTAAQVARCTTFCVANRVPFRVRSGGHQHEGMSSLENGVMIRLSELDAIEYRGEDRAWIGVGKALKEIYDELELRGKTIPGGGCWSVNVGGLALGGGWGTSARYMGLTCDNFEEVEMVTANGDVIRARDDNEHRDLFWALRGGGGGNFGIVTRFLFRLSDIEDKTISTFSMQWRLPEHDAEDKLTAIVRDYLALQATFPPELTTAMGLRVKHRFMETYYPLGLSGKFYGSKEELNELLRPLHDQHPTIEPEPRFETRSFAEDVDHDDPASEPILLSDLINGVVDFVHLGERLSDYVEPENTDRQRPAPPSTTCLAPWPHKISSGFPKSPDVYANLARKAVRLLLTSNADMPKSDARLYLVLHGMPGSRAGIAPTDSAFFWRDKDVLVQFQAWWAEPCFATDDRADQRAYQREEETYVCWIQDARKQLECELEGAFINFVDRDLPLEAYYGDNFARLREIKERYDYDNVFHFPMSIPPRYGALQPEVRSLLTASGCEVVTRDQAGYQDARRISNERFDLRPAAVVYPETAEQVAQCVDICREHRLDLRIRSGGHQHEAMSSANDVLMVRLSKMRCIEYVEGAEDQAWIGAGARLEDVYEELKQSHRIIAAGGCHSVNLGGLTLGGGWGLSARKHGLACDNVLAIEVVLADGRIVVATPDENENGYADLFWALLGSGGGNFGIVTRFLVKLHKIEPTISKYKLYWHATGAARQQVIETWLAFQRLDQSNNTTSYLVLFGDLDNRNEEKTTVYAGGMSYSYRQELEAEIHRLTSSEPKPDKEEYEIVELSSGVGEAADALNTAVRTVNELVNYAETPPGLFDSALALLDSASRHTAGQDNDCHAPFPTNNCLGSYPHKVTSAFAKLHESPESYERRLAEVLARFLDDHPVSPNVKSTIALYAMGGAVAERSPSETAFWYRDRPFMLQIEAWWAYPETGSASDPCDCRHRTSWQQPYIDWVRRCRDTLEEEGLVDGAFINFVDRDLEPRNKSTEDRIKLLRHYYGGNLEQLMKSKARWDPTDFFRFEMSIPLPAES